MQVIIINHKNTGEMMGLVTPSENKYDFIKLVDIVRDSWKRFNEENDVEESESDDDFLEDFCEFHNIDYPNILIETAIFNTI